MGMKLRVTIEPAAILLFAVIIHYQWAHCAGGDKLDEGSKPILDYAARFKKEGPRTTVYSVRLL
jgi:hypothetical protein